MFYFSRNFSGLSNVHDLSAITIHADIKEASQQGRNDGADNYPEAHASGPGEAERAVIYQARKRILEAEAMGHKAFSDYRRKVEDLALEKVEDDFSDIESETERQVRECSLMNKKALLLDKGRECQRMRDLSHFKAEHRLFRSPIYPHSVIYHLAWTGPLLVVECLFNMYFFASGSDFGYAGGFFQALLISAVNVMVCILVAWLGFRQLNHRSALRKVAGCLSVACWVAFLCVFHLLVAHYRDLLVLDPDHAESMVLNAFVARPFRLVTQESVVVLLIGIVIGVLAAIKGYGADDPYPGYGRMDRLFKRAAENYHAGLDRLRDHLIQTFKTAAEQVRKRLSAYEARMTEISDICGQAESSLVDLETACRQIGLDLREILTAYRQANLQVRTQAPPVHFEDMPDAGTLPNREWCQTQLAEIMRIKTASEEKMKDLRQKAANMLEAINQKHAGLEAFMNDIACEIESRTYQQ